jgi:hypothetical protein
MVNDRAMSRYFARLEATPHGIVACGGRANAGSSLAMRSRKDDDHEATAAFPHGFSPM